MTIWSTWRRVSNCDVASFERGIEPSHHPLLAILAEANVPSLARLHLFLIDGKVALTKRAISPGARQGREFLTAKTYGGVFYDTLTPSIAVGYGAA